VKPSRGSFLGQRPIQRAGKGNDDEEKYQMSEGKRRCKVGKLGGETRSLNGEEQGRAKVSKLPWYGGEKSGCGREGVSRLAVLTGGEEGGRSLRVEGKRVVEGGRTAAGARGMEKKKTRRRTTKRSTEWNQRAGGEEK